MFSLKRAKNNKALSRDNINCNKTVHLSAGNNEKRLKKLSLFNLLQKITLLSIFGGLPLIIVLAFISTIFNINYFFTYFLDYIPQIFYFLGMCNSIYTVWLFKNILKAGKTSFKKVDPNKYLSVTVFALYSNVLFLLPSFFATIHNDSLLGK